MSVDMTESLPFTLCADGHAPWIADEVKIGRAVALRSLSAEVMADELNAN